MSLGCVNDYTVVLHNRGGARAIAVLEPLVSVMWQRRLNARAAATVTVGKGGASAQCCAALAQISPWAHEATVYRGGALVWQGPVLRPVESRDTFTVDAVDVTGWFDVRAVAQTYEYTAYDSGGGALPPTDAVKIARKLLGDAFATNDPNIRPYFTFTDGTNLSEQKAIARVDVVGEQFDDLVTQGLDYTTVGRRVVITPPGHLAATARPVTVLADDMLGGEITLTREGSSTATRVYNHSSSVDDSEGPPPMGVAGGADAYYGLVERVVELNAFTGSLANMNAIAQRDLALSYPAPLVVRVADGASLHPDAPVELDELVCGVRVDVALTRGWCQQAAAAAMRLAAVTGEWDSGGERIAVSLENLGGGVSPSLTGEG